MQENVDFCIIPKSISEKKIMWNCMINSIVVNQNMKIIIYEPMKNIQREYCRYNGIFLFLI